jgi:hypothetical protein
VCVCVFQTFSQGKNHLATFLGDPVSNLGKADH